MSEIRELRRSVGLSQQAYAALLDVPVETYRPWDSGRRAVPLDVLYRARKAVAEYARQTLLPAGSHAASWSVILSRSAIGPGRTRWGNASAHRSGSRYLAATHGRGG